MCYRNGKFIIQLKIKQVSIKILFMHPVYLGGLKPCGFIHQLTDEGFKLRRI